MPARHLRSLAPTIVCTTIALAVLAMLPANSQEKEKPKKGDSIKPGFANTEKTGTLPVFTKELAIQGANAISKREWSKARKIYSEMLAAEPDNALAHANLGVVEFEQGNYEQAKIHLEKAVTERPALGQVWLTLGILHYRQKSYHLALSAISRAVHENPKDPVAHNYLAVVIKHMGWSNGAEAELQRAIDLNDSYAEAHFNLALMYLERKPPATELARRHYNRAKKLGADPDALVEKQLKEQTTDKEKTKAKKKS